MELSERACFSAFVSSLVDMQSVAQTSRVNVRMGKLRIENDIDTVTLLAPIDKINNNVDAKRKHSQFFAYLWKCIPEAKCYLIFGSYVSIRIVCAPNRVWLSLRQASPSKCSPAGTGTQQQQQPAHYRL